MRHLDVFAAPEKKDDGTFTKGYSFFEFSNVKSCELYIEINCLSGAQSSRKSSVSTAAPEVLVTRPADKDRDGQNEAVNNNEAKPKNVLSLLPVIELQTISYYISI